MYLLGLGSILSETPFDEGKKMIQKNINVHVPIDGFVDFVERLVVL